MTGFQIGRRAALKGMGAIGIMSAVGARPALAAPTKWEFPIVYGPGHPSTLHYTAFADDLRKRSNGEFDVTVRTAGELPFKATEHLTVTGQGQVPMALGYMGFIAGTAKIAAIPGLPFLISNEAECDRAMEVLLPFVNKALGQHGAEVLLWNGQHWPQNLYGRGEAVSKLEQISQRKGRGSTTEQSDIIMHYGGTPITLTTAEVPEAMERGLVDLLFTGAANITGSKWTEFLEWGYLCNPHLGIEYVMINSQDYQGLPADLRKVLDETVADHRAIMSAGLKKVQDDSDAELRSKLKILDATPEDVRRYEADWAPYWSKWADSAGPDGPAALKALRDTLGK